MYLANALILIVSLSRQDIDASFAFILSPIFTTEHRSLNQEREIPQRG
jgi:hypothetical protein